ncbi:MAG TPA: glycosyltransferase family 1 protein [Thermomicrobiales bacterium]
MRVGINALLLSNRSGYRRSGIGRYLDRLLGALPAALGDDQLVAYAGRGVDPPHPSLTRSWRRAWVPSDRPPLRIAWEQTALPVAARRDRLDVFHGTMNVLPRSLPCPAVVTVHDLAFLRWPDQVPARRYRYLSVGLKAATKRAARIIAVSASTKSDLVELLAVDPSRITVTHLGVDARFRPPGAEERRALLDRHRLVRPYLLAVGNLEPRKNLPALLRAFARLAPDIPHDLVLIGAEGWLTGEIHATLAALRLGGRVRMTGFVDDDELPVWYGAADLFVYPSRYEGFGLPVVEAMACGTPVVTSNVSSLPEIGGDAALLVDPADEASIADGVRRVLTDPAFAGDLRRRGRHRAAEFTWERTAAQTVAVYREVAG